MKRLNKDLAVVNINPLKVSTSANKDDKWIQDRSKPRSQIIEEIKKHVAINLDVSISAPIIILPTIYSEQFSALIIDVGTIEIHSDINDENKDSLYDSYKLQVSPTIV